jgi:hypothetical protein
MAKWRKNESLGKAMAREGKSIISGVARELLSLATLGLAKPRKPRFRLPSSKRKP